MKIILSIFLTISFLGNVFAQYSDFNIVKNTKEISEKISSYSKKINTLKSDFVQEKHLSILEQPIVSKGDFLYKKQNKILWRYNQPVNYTIIINNNKFYIKDQSKLSTYDIKSNPVFKQINNMIVSSINGDIVNNKNFKINFYENKTQYLAVLEPVDDNVKKMIKSIEMYFNKTDLFVEKLKMVENKTDFTLIKFKNKQQNINIPDADFIIKKD